MIKLQERLCFMLLGGLLVVTGQLLPSFLGVDVNAEDKESKIAEFEAIRCKKLSIINQAGNDALIMETDKHGGNISLIDNLGVKNGYFRNDQDGGVFGILSQKTPMSRVHMSFGGVENTAFVSVGYQSEEKSGSLILSHDSNGGSITFVDKNGMYAGTYGINDNGGLAIYDFSNPRKN
ncbi:TPA: hypothetical protein EYN98_02785 [Candidatus Poribacteria bacterium]|nr:hypothetical protein [Candidatus Poribacteria bacterium]HIA64993.1 hypothetical protein [Candidatus Poribacteria bacterium]HIB90000.1 hypothetical protein [Candidatus Poribacteria bacterium]HIC02928.1 hypothetical protein [Candidatus Poribacteria bacterium]HIC19424.1 hypothetical protein [Candidatus Poribacteria bacterium]